MTTTVPNMSNLKQGKLSFTSAKRTNAATNGKAKKGTSATKSSSCPIEKDKTEHKDTSAEKQSDSRPSRVVEISSDEEDTIAAESTVPAKRTRSGTKPRSSSGTTKQAPTPAQTSKSEKQEQSLVEAEREHLDVEDKAGRYRRYYNEVRSKMGYMQPIHSEGQNRIHQMLRFFDMSYEFGPYIGMTRLERWKRAEAFGLNPPIEVRDILLTKEGVEKAEYAHSVLHGEV